MKQTRGPRDTVFGDLCEVFRLLELRGEYESFIVDLDAELAFLSHIVECKLCGGEAKMMVNREGGDDTWWSKLFSGMFPETLGRNRYRSNPVRAWMTMGIWKRLSLQESDGGFSG